ATANIRLFIATEAGLVQLRNRAFAHIHHLSVLTQNTERRGALVSRVTTDVDTISRFVQWGGMQLIMSSLQLLGATVAMAIYSWKLTIIVWLVFVPMLLLAPKAQAALNRRFSTVRVKAGVMLAAISEAVVGAQTIRAYGVGTRTRNRIDESIEDYRSTEARAQVLASLSFSTGTLLSGVALGVAVIDGTPLGVAEPVTGGAASAPAPATSATSRPRLTAPPGSAPTCSPPCPAPPAPPCRGSPSGWPSSPAPSSVWTSRSRSGSCSPSSSSCRSSPARCKPRPKCSTTCKAPSPDGAE